MKILAIGDLHGDLTQAKKLAEQAEKEKVDLVILNGDFTFFGNHTPGLIQVFKDKGKKIALLPWNHESLATTEFLAKKYGVINLHNYSMSFGEIGIFGSGSASDSELLSSLKKSYNYIKSSKNKIMFTHFHPDKTLISRLGYFMGSRAIKKAIEELKPDLAICSHIHEAEGIEETIGKTKVLCIGKKGKIIEL